MRGRTPKPTALKLLQGNPGHRQIDMRSEPSPVLELGAPPAHLDDDAKRYWMELGPQLVKLGTLGKSDAGLFGLFCQAHSRNLWLSQRIDRLRRLKRLGSKEEKQLERYENQRLKNSAQIQKIGSEFGIGAASRTRIRVDVDEKQREFGFVEKGSSLNRVVQLSREAQ